MLDNIPTKVWGPAMWQSLHNITFGYPSNPSELVRQQYKTFFSCLSFVLPCSICRDSYTKIIQDKDTLINDTNFKNKDTLIKWLYEIHEKVNKKLNVKQTKTLPDLYKDYQSIISCNKCVFSVTPTSFSDKFLDYAKKRNISDKRIDLYNKLRVSSNKKLWDKRDKLCNSLTDLGLEETGKYKGMPKLDEIKLILLRATTLDTNS